MPSLSHLHEIRVYRWSHRWGRSLIEVEVLEEIASAWVVPLTKHAGRLTKGVVPCVWLLVAVWGKRVPLVICEQISSSQLVLIEDVWALIVVLIHIVVCLEQVCIGAWSISSSKSILVVVSKHRWISKLVLILRLIEQVTVGGSCHCRLPLGRKLIEWSKTLLGWRTSKRHRFWVETCRLSYVFTSG